jgi:hypothetical protein
MASTSIGSSCAAREEDWERRIASRHERRRTEAGDEATGSTRLLMREGHSMRCEVCVAICGTDAECCCCCGLDVQCRWSLSVGESRARQHSAAAAARAQVSTSISRSRSDPNKPACSHQLANEGRRQETAAAAATRGTSSDEQSGRRRCASVAHDPSLSVSVCRLSLPAACRHSKSQLAAMPCECGAATGSHGAASPSRSQLRGGCEWPDSEENGKEERRPRARESHATRKHHK